MLGQIGQVWLSEARQELPPRESLQYGSELGWERPKGSAISCAPRETPGNTPASCGPVKCKALIAKLLSSECSKFPGFTSPPTSCSLCLKKGPHFWQSQFRWVCQAQTSQVTGLGRQFAGAVHHHCDDAFWEHVTSTGATVMPCLPRRTYGTTRPRPLVFVGNFVHLPPE